MFTDENVPGYEGLVIDELNKMKARGFWPHVGISVAAQVLDSRLVITNEQDLLKFRLTSEEIEAIISEASDKVVDSYNTKYESSKSSHLKKTSNSAEYTYQFVAEVTGKGGWNNEKKENEEIIPRWNLNKEIRSPGLLVRTIKELGETETVSLMIVNGLPFFKNEDGVMVQGTPEWSKWGESWTISGERLAWKDGSKALAWLQNMFPSGVDLVAYNHSLNAPTLPGGFFKAKILFRKIEVEGVDLQTDGSGWYHPEAPEMSELVAKYGLRPFQFRFINQNGTFAKGMIFPCELSKHDDQPCISLDWSQIKGKNKAGAKSFRKNNKSLSVEGFFGAIQVWHKKSTLSGGFELLENIQRNARTEEIITKLLKKKFGKMGQMGVDFLLARIAKDDPSLARMMDFCLALKAKGVDIHPMQVPTIRSTVQEKLSNFLWLCAQGAGIEFPQYAARLDATIPKGKCVVSGIAPGTKVAGYRFPIIHSQGLVVLETIAPSEHMLIDGKMPLNQCIMSPSDLTFAMQGDDDGDIVGISADPEMVELFSNKLDDLVFHLEGTNIRDIVISSKSPEFKAFALKGPQRPLVGRLTIQRAKLLAVGDKMGAIALSLLIQQAVDMAKKIPKWVDYQAAASLVNWKKLDDGSYSFHRTAPMTQMEEENPDMIDIKKINFWVANRLIAAGHFEEIVVNGRTKKKAINPLTWRNEGKKIVPAFWRPCQKVPGFGNLVHFCYDTALSEWQKIEEKFKLTSPVVDFVRELELFFSDIQESPLSHEDLLEKSGLRSHGQVWSHILKGNWSETRRLELINDNTERLHESLMQCTEEELITLFLMELRLGKPANLNKAFKTVCFEGSPILARLGLSYEAKSCNFLNPERLGKVLKWITAGNAVVRLNNFVFSSTSHAENCKDELGQPIQQFACKDCMETLNSAVMSSIRRESKFERETELRPFIASLN